MWFEWLKGLGFNKKKGPHLEKAAQMIIWLFELGLIWTTVLETVDIKCKWNPSVSFSKSSLE